MDSSEFKNPYRPGAGHMPPYLAGREKEYAEFDRLLRQDEILENLVLTGLRGVGKTVLLETFKPRALKAGWLWASADLSESASISEVALAQRLLADLALVSSSATVANPDAGKAVGFAAPPVPEEIPLSHDVLVDIYEGTPGLTADKIKATLEFAWEHLEKQGQRKVIFAYDEAQNLSDHASRDQFPLSILLDVFQSIQKKGIPFMLVLAGLPTLFPKLVDARTYAERMFRVMTLTKLKADESREAILKPIEVADCPVKLTPSRSRSSSSSQLDTPISSSSSAGRFTTSSSDSTRTMRPRACRSKRSSTSSTRTSLLAGGQGSPTGSGNCSGWSPTLSTQTKNSPSRN